MARLFLTLVFLSLAIGGVGAQSLSAIDSVRGTSARIMRAARRVPVWRTINAIDYARSERGGPQSREGGAEGVVGQAQLLATAFSEISFEP
jgi:hypothetical protein